MQDQDIIINSTGNGTLGRIGIFRDADRIDKSIIVPDSHVAIVRLQPSFNKDFLLYVLTYYQPYLEKLGEGSTNQTELKPAVIADLFVPIPPLSEQHRIVSKIEQLLPYIDHYDETEQKLTTLNAEFPDKLKKSILQIAVQGKLAPQNPTDEPASVLLEKIRAEKENLIKQGKIKRDKNESVIYKRDKEYFEKQNGVEICISDQIPFEIPEGWEWCRLGTIISLQSGQDMTPDKYNSIQNGIPYLTGASNIDNNNVIINRWTDCPKSIAYKGNLLITCKGTIGSMAFLNETKAHIARQIMAISMCGSIDLSYIRWFLETYIVELKANAKSMIPGISRDDILNAFFPLPPLSEQHRIVAKIEEILPLCEKLS